jgi:hypothetical protein
LPVAKSSRKTYDGSLRALKNCAAISSSLVRSSGRQQVDIVDLPLPETMPILMTRASTSRSLSEVFHELEEKNCERHQAQTQRKIHYRFPSAKAWRSFLIDGLVGVALFFAVAIGITFVKLLWFTHRFKSTLAVVVATWIAFSSWVCCEYRRLLGRPY